MTNSTKPKRAPNRVQSRRVVQRDRREYRGFFRLNEKDKLGKPIHRTDKDGQPIYCYQLSWNDESRISDTNKYGRVQKRAYCHNDTEADEQLSIEIARSKEIRETGAPKTASAESFDVYAKKFLDHQENVLSEAEFVRQRGVVNTHLMKAFGGKALKSITRADLIAYINKRQGEVSAGTVLKERNILRRLLNRAEDDEVIINNPWSRQRMRGYAPKQPEGRVRYLTPDEWKTVYAACRIEAGKDGKEPHQWLQEIAAFALVLGARRSELMHTTVPDVDLERGGVNLRITKSGKRRWVPFKQFGRMVVDMMGLAERKKKGDRRVLWPGITLEQASMRFIRACKKAGVEDFSLHDLRHTFASWQAMKGVSLRTIQELLGHADPRMTARYAHLSPEHLADAVTTLDGVFTLPGQTVTVEAKALPAPVEGS